MLRTSLHEHKSDIGQVLHDGDRVYRGTNSLFKNMRWKAETYPNLVGYSETSRYPHSWEWYPNASSLYSTCPPENRANNSLVHFEYRKFIVSHETDVTLGLSSQYVPSTCSMNSGRQWRRFSKNFEHVRLDWESFRQRSFWLFLRCDYDSDLGGCDTLHRELWVTYLGGAHKRLSDSFRILIWLMMRYLTQRSVISNMVMMSNNAEWARI